MLQIKSGNVFEYIEQVDAIVNSNNKYMISGSGMCGLLYKLAGKDELEKFCKDNYSELMKKNEVRITPGFNIKKDIIHIYVPKYYEEVNVISLIESYKLIFEVAYEKGYKTILSVSIGTGVHGYKHEEVAASVISIINILTKQFGINFILVLPTEDIAEIYIKSKMID